MRHRQLQVFFNGAHDVLVASFAASTSLTNETKGSSREEAVRGILQRILPPMVRIEPGDVIDAEGQQSGQLDGVVIDERSPTLKLASDGHGLILAEGVIAILELKSDLSTQWAQVESTYSKILPLHHRATDGASFGKPFEETLPFMVLGWRGWASSTKTMEKVTALAKSAGSDPVPPLFVLTLDPPNVCVIVRGEGLETHADIPPDARGAVLAELWFQITARARNTLQREIPFADYWAARRWERAPLPVIPLPDMSDIIKPGMK